MTFDKATYVLSVFLVSAVYAAGIWDLLAMFVLPNADTISETIRRSWMGPALAAALVVFAVIHFTYRR